VEESFQWKAFLPVLALMAALQLPATGCRKPDSSDETAPGMAPAFEEQRLPGGRIVRRMPFSAESVEIETDPDSGFAYVRIDGYEPDLTDPATPVLPLKFLRVELPAGARVTGARLEVAETARHGPLKIPGFRRHLELPDQPGIGEFVALEAFAGAYPREPVSFEAVQSESRTVANILFHPVAYRAESLQLTIFTRGYLLIEYTLAEQAANKEPDHETPHP
jgi:hypothetical protein